MPLREGSDMLLINCNPKGIIMSFSKDRGSYIIVICSGSVLRAHLIGSGHGQVVRASTEHPLHDPRLAWRLNQLLPLPIWERSPAISFFDKNLAARSHPRVTHHPTTRPQGAVWIHMGALSLAHAIKGGFWHVAD